jgi:predicted restriction endonuclease
MSQDSVERFLGRVITDTLFRERAARSLEQCCASEGYPLTQAESALLEKVDFRLLGFVSTTLDDAIRRN